MLLGVREVGFIHPALQAWSFRVIFFSFAGNKLGEGGIEMQNEGNQARTNTREET